MFFVFVFFLLFVGNNQNSCGKLQNNFVMWAGDYEQMIQHGWTNLRIS